MRTHRSHQRPPGSPSPQRPRIPKPHPLPLALTAAQRCATSTRQCTLNHEEPLFRTRGDVAFWDLASRCRVMAISMHSRRRSPEALEARSEVRGPEGDRCTGSPASAGRRYRYRSWLRSDAPVADSGCSGAASGRACSPTCALRAGGIRRPRAPRRNHVGGGCRHRDNSRDLYTATRVRRGHRKRKSSVGSAVTVASFFGSTYVMC